MSAVHVGDEPDEWEDWGEIHIVHFHNFRIMPMVQGKAETARFGAEISIGFSGRGEQWTLDLYPGGNSEATQGNISLCLNNHYFPRGTKNLIHFDIAIKNSNGEDVLGAGHSWFGLQQRSWDWPDFCSRAMITESNVLKHGSLTVEFRIKPEDRLPFYIPKNHFGKNMLLQLLSDGETADISFKVESLPPIDTSEACVAPSCEVFCAHKLVIKTCAKGSILASLCESCDGSEHVPIKDVHPKVFRLLLRYIYGGEITAAEWKNHGKDLIAASDKYDLANIKIEAEWWYVKHIKFSPADVVEVVAYAAKMNCFLLKEAATNFIVANVDEVLSSGTVKDIPETKDIMHDILVSVSSVNKKKQKRKFSRDNFDQHSINDLRNELAWQGKDVDGSRETLISRLEDATRTAASRV